MRLIENHQVRFQKKSVCIRVTLKSRPESLDSRNDDMILTRRQRSRLPVPHSGNLKWCTSADIRPHLPPSLNRLFAKLIPVGDPDDAAGEVAFAHSVDNRLHGDARLARPGRHADHASSRRVVAFAIKHALDVGYNSLLVIMKFGK